MNVLRMTLIPFSFFLKLAHCVSKRAKVKVQPLPFFPKHYPLNKEPKIMAKSKIVAKPKPGSWHKQEGNNTINFIH